MDRYDSNTADGDVSEQEHVRSNSDVFNSPLTTLRATRKKTLDAQNHMAP